MNKKNKIAVAMSGGVDSSVAAMLVKEKGYDIFGITMKHFEGSEAQKVIDDAKKVADFLNIEHHVIDLTKEFKKDIKDYFISSYQKGETPSPCIVCNSKIKFGYLLEAAVNLGAEKIVTGHYAKIVNKNNKIQIHKGDDEHRDQTYFLFDLTLKQLEKAWFPLADIEKTKIRKIAEKNNIPVANKADSQDICFIPNKNYVSFICKNSSQFPKKGDMLDKYDKVIRKHDGFINFTIGQRKGLGIGGTKEPCFVTKIDAKNNRVYVGNKEDLKVNVIEIDKLNWLGDEKFPLKDKKYLFKFRSRQQEVLGKIELNDDNSARIITDDSVYAIAKGQGAVIYENKRLLGGGFIKNSYKEKNLIKPKQ